MDYSPIKGSKASPAPVSGRPSDGLDYLDLETTVSPRVHSSSASSKKQSEKELKRLNEHIHFRRPVLASRDNGRGSKQPQSCAVRRKCMSVCDIAVTFPLFVAC